MTYWKDKATENGITIKNAIHKDNLGEKMNVKFYEVPSGGGVGNSPLWDRLWVVQDSGDNPDIYNETNELVVDLESIPYYCFALMYIYEEYMK